MKNMRLDLKYSISHDKTSVLSLKHKTQTPQKYAIMSFSLIDDSTGWNYYIDQLYSFPRVFQSLGIMTAQSRASWSPSNIASLWYREVKRRPSIGPLLCGEVRACRGADVDTEKYF